jgi:hypothetical protein
MTARSSNASVYHRHEEYFSFTVTRNSANQTYRDAKHYDYLSFAFFIVKLSVEFLNYYAEYPRKYSFKNFLNYLIHRKP